MTRTPSARRAGARGDWRVARRSACNTDHTKTFCIYDAPTPEAIRRCAGENALPVDTITEVSVLDPYFYRTD